MIALAAAVALVVVGVVVAGGDLRRLAGVRLRWAGLLVVSAVLQLLVLGVLGDRLGSDGAGAMHVASYVPTLAVVSVNRHLRGMVVVGLGGAANLAAIVANGGVMPASPRALAAAGLEVPVGRFVNSTVVDGARLAWLGDVFAWPHPLPGATVFSVGDVVLLVGLAGVLHAVTAPRRRHAHRRRRRQHARRRPFLTAV